MKKLNNTQGFSHILVFVLAIVVIGIASFGAWRVAGNTSDEPSPATATSQASTVPNSISSKDDVTQARQAIESDESDTSLNDTQLDKDISSLY